MNRSSNPLIPRKVLFSDPDIDSPRLSPDGTRISYLAPVNGALNLWVGPADDPSESRPPYWVPEIELFRKRVGDHLTEAGRLFLKHRSPVNYAGWIKRLLLICHGANDPRVRQSESDQIVRIMQEKNLPVIYLLYPDEGHGLVRAENRLFFSAVAEIFLSRCLHGRCEPAGDDLGNSSMTVPAGARFIPDLKEAIWDK